MKTFEARRPHLFSLALLAVLGLTFILTHSLDRVRAMASVAASPAMTFTVTSTADSGEGSLRDAIAVAAAGEKIAFVSTRDGGTQEIYVMNADGTNPTQQHGD